MGAVSAIQVLGLELEKVQPKLTDVFEYDDKFFTSIQKRNVEVISNRLMRVPLALQPGGNFGYFDPNGGDMGRGSGPIYDKATLSSIWMREAFEYTKQAEWGTNTDRKAIVSLVRDLTTRSMKEIKRQIDAQMMQPGTGQIGEIESVATSGGVDTYTLTPEFGARLVRDQQNVQVFDSTLATNRGTGEISNWDIQNSTIQVPAITGATAGDVLITQGLSNPTSLPALYGVPYQHSNASSGVWLGLNRATNSTIRSNGINGNNNALSLPLPRLAINAIGNRVGIDNNFNPVAWMHPCQKQAYEEIGQLVSMIWKQPTEQALDMYFDKMQMAGAPVKDHFNWNKTRIDFVVDSTWGRGETLPIGYYKVDGRSVFEVRGPSGGVITADLFYLCVGMQTFVNNPAATAYIYDLAIPDGYN